MGWSKRDSVKVKRWTKTWKEKDLAMWRTVAIAFLQKGSNQHYPVKKKLICLSCWWKYQICIQVKYYKRILLAGDEVTTDLNCGVSWPSLAREPAFKLEGINRRKSIRLVSWKITLMSCLEEQDQIKRREPIWERFWKQYE